jgi:hypothetical protein
MTFSAAGHWRHRVRNDAGQFDDPLDPDSPSYMASEQGVRDEERAMRREETAGPPPGDDERTPAFLAWACNNLADGWEQGAERRACRGEPQAEIDDALARATHYRREAGRIAAGEIRIHADFDLISKGVI